MSLIFIKKIIIYFNSFILYYVLCINTIYFIQLVLSAFSLSDYIKKILYSDYKKYGNSENMLPISVLVPAYNEENTIVDNIKSLLSLNYSNFEVVVINDGSKDTTLEKIINEFSLRKFNQPVRYRIKTKEILGIYKNIDIPNLVLVNKKNGGKADALNVGVNISKYPLFAAIDADSVIESDSLVRVTMPFIEDKETIAVGGIVRIVNGSLIKGGVVKKIDLPKNKVAMFQIIEYLRAFLTGRMGWDYISSLLIISGAFGAFNKARVIEVGGYKVGTIGEDMELVVRLHEYMHKKKLKYKIKFIPDPVCWTQCPESFKDLRSQRRRWQIGLMDSLFRYKNILLNPSYGTIGLLAAPYFWFFEMIGPIIEVIGYILIPLSYFAGILNLRFFILFLVTSILYGVILSLGAVLLEEYTFNKYPGLRQLAKLTFYGILENFGYRQLTVLFRIEGILKFRKQRHSWGKINRKKFS